MAFVYDECPVFIAGIQLVGLHASTENRLALGQTTLKLANKKWLTVVNANVKSVSSHFNHAAYVWGSILDKRARDRDEAEYQKTDTLSDTCKRQTRRQP